MTSKLKLAAAFALGLALAGVGNALGQTAAQGYAPVTGPSTVTTVSTAPTSIAGSAAFTSPCLPANYARAYTVFAGMAAAATLSTQRYADVGCTRPAGAAVPASPLALTNAAACPSAGYCGNVSQNDGLPFLGFKFTVTDTSTATNAVRNMTVLQAPE